MKRPALLLCIGALFCQLGLALADPDTPSSDAMSRALNDELKRSMTLQLEDLAAPYLIQYEVVDGVSSRITASYGAILDSDESRSRILESQVRVGTYQLDNSNFTDSRGPARSGLASSARLPLDDSYLALRQAVWLTTDAQYRTALETLTRKQAYIKDHNVEERPPDFTRTAPLISLTNRTLLPTFDRKRWEDYARKISAQFAEFNHVQNAEVSLAFGVENRVLINSEGSRVLDGHPDALLRITAESQAQDGQRLSDALSYYAPNVDQLPALADVQTAARQLAARLTEAIRAPILDDYSGPVLFEGLAATQLFRQLLARGFTGQSDPLGSARRTAQNTDDLDNRIGKRILPADFQIYDDPREPQYEGVYLAGHYLIDDEAVSAQRVNIVVDGKLEGMVMSRTPTKFFAQSNGHGRRGGAGAPRAALGCLYVESAKGKSLEALKKDLRDAADGEGLKFGLRITGLQSRSGGGDAAGPGGRFRRGGGARRTVGDPIWIYKVFVSDGHEEMVRSCEFTSVDVQSLRKILGASSVRTVQNSVVGSTPSSSIIAPAVLIGEMELSKIKAETEKNPILHPPSGRD